MKALKFLSVFVLLMIMSPVKVTAIDTKDTRPLQQPAISDQPIAFIYAHDLWVANTNGRYPRRLTLDEKNDSRPVFSSDGKYIAFSAEYDGNTDMYYVPGEEGYRGSGCFRSMTIQWWKSQNPRAEAMTFHRCGLAIWSISGVT